jgi:hypothetical protein
LENRISIERKGLGGKTLPAPQAGVMAELTKGILGSEMQEKFERFGGHQKD